MAEVGQRPTLRRLLLRSGLHARREEGSERTADGDCGQSLPIPFERQKRGGQASGQKDERAESEIQKVVSHKLWTAAWTTAGLRF